MKWADLARSDATEKAIRVAIAEKVMKWNVGKHPEAEDYGLDLDGLWAWEDDNLIILSLDHNWEGEGFFPERVQCDLAKALIAAQDRMPHLFSQHLEAGYIWWIGLRNPRAAACQLLDLLEIQVPEGLA